jgi:serine/threonine protein kinase
MPAPATADELLELVRKSGVLPDDRLGAYLEPLRATQRLPAKPSDLAEQLIRDGLVTRFQADQLLHGKWRGFFLGHYTLLGRLGAGGMAMVFLAEHKTLHRRVALKVLPTNHAQDEESLKRFYREARAAAALEHPNIVRAYDIDKDEKVHFLVMEYVEGKQLHDLVRKHGPLDVPRAADYIRQAASGLAHAHAAGLVHRDIKPGNLIVDTTGTVKILDMGLARFLQEGGEVLTQGVLGTPDYLAPEQVEDSHRVDIRADIYSLGATLYYCLTGRPPFAEGTPAQKMIAHQTREPPPIGTFRPGVPIELEEVVGTMMAKSPANRYQTPAEVVEALTPWAAPTPLPPPALRPAHPDPTPHLARETCPDVQLTPLAPPMTPKPVVRPPQAPRSTAPPRTHVRARRTASSDISSTPIAPPKPPVTPPKPAKTAAPSFTDVPKLPPLPPPQRRFAWLTIMLIAVGIAAGIVGWLILHLRGS